MEVIRPKLVSFRVTKFHGENPGSVNGQETWSLQLNQTIEIELGVSSGTTEKLQARIKIDLEARAFPEGTLEALAGFNAAYEAKFDYSQDVTEEKIAPLMEQDHYQYGLVAQAFPLAMTHFRRELQSLGFDARELPLGL